MGKLFLMHDYTSIVALPLLLMDNFPAHELGVEQLGISAQNPTVIWHPPNAISIHQLLDQGITHSVYTL
jgi:hypothetical protein